MICTLTARRVSAGSGDAFRDAFEQAGRSAPEDIITRWTRVYVCRDVTDPDVMLTFGFFDGTLEELREIQGRAGDADPAVALSAYVEAVLLDGSYAVIDEITP